ncbi:MAG: hypothetical protein KGJ09_10645, partial [Candidatus Omnitrophica bacterium]|nr:hypothetical protein [Candidatus Omnitrophota bacterium]
VVYSPKTDTASGQLNLVDAANIGPVLADFIRKVPTDTSRWNPENDKAMAAPLVLDGKTVPQSPLADVLDHLKTKQDFDHQEIWEITDLQNFTGRLNELKQLIDLYNESHSSKEKIKLDVAGDNTIKPASGGKSTNDLGGIDLTAANMNLQTFNGGASIHFNLDPAQLAQLHNAPGFVPVIINIRPLPAGQAGIADLRIFLGLDGRQAVS